MTRIERFCLSDNGIIEANVKEFLDVKDVAGKAYLWVITDTELPRAKFFVNPIGENVPVPKKVLEHARFIGTTVDMGNTWHWFLNGVR